MAEVDDPAPPVTAAAPQTSPTTPFALRLSHGLYFGSLAAAPALVLVGMAGLSPHPRDSVPNAVWWVLVISAVAGSVAYWGISNELCEPPKSALRTLLLVFDTPLLVLAGSMAGGGLHPEVFVYDGLIEISATALGLIPIQWTGSFRVEAKEGKEKLYAMGLIAVFAVGPLGLLGLVCAPLVLAGQWWQLALMAVALGVSTRAYYRLIRFAPSHDSRWGWILFGIFLVFAAFVLIGVING